MIELTPEQFSQSDFAAKFALNREGTSPRFRPNSPMLKELFLVHLDLDKSGQSQAIRVQVPKTVLSHPVLKPVLSRLLMELTGSNESGQDWFKTFEPPELSLHEITMALSVDGTDATFTLQRKRKGFWSFFSH